MDGPLRSERTIPLNLCDPLIALPLLALTFISGELPPFALCLQSGRRRPLQVLLLLLGRNVYRGRLQGFSAFVIHGILPAHRLGLVDIDFRVTFYIGFMF